MISNKESSVSSRIDKEPEDARNNEHNSYVLTAPMASALAEHHAEQPKLTSFKRE